jgi:hypothetical protein
LDPPLVGHAEARLEHRPPVTAQPAIVPQARREALANKADALVPAARQQVDDRVGHCGFVAGDDLAESAGEARVGSPMTCPTTTCGAPTVSNSSIRRRSTRPDMISPSRLRVYSSAFSMSSEASAPPRHRAHLEPRPARGGGLIQPTEHNRVGFVFEAAADQQEAEAKRGRLAAADGAQSPRRSRGAACDIQACG